MMEYKYQGKFESELIKDGYQFKKIIGDLSLYRDDQDNVVIARVTDKGRLEIMLETKIQKRINGT